MANFNALIDNVGHKAVGAVLSTSTLPTRVQALVWLNDAQKILARELHPLLIPSLVKEHSASTGAAAIKTAVPSNMIRPISCFCNSNASTQKPLKLISYQEYAEIKAGTHSYLATTSYVYTMGYDGSNVVFYYYPSSDPDEKTWVYVAAPTTMTDAATECDFPDEVEDLLVDYGIAQHKLQDEEIEIYNTMMKAFYGRIERLNKNIL